MLSGRVVYVGPCVRCGYSRCSFVNWFSPLVVVERVYLMIVVVVAVVEIVVVAVVVVVVVAVVIGCRWN